LERGITSFFTVERLSPTQISITNYIDCALSTPATTRNVGSFTSTFSGNQIYPDGGFNIMMDEIQLYNRVLTAEESTRTLAGCLCPSQSTTNTATQTGTPTSSYTTTSTVSLTPASTPSNTITPVSAQQPVGTSLCDRGPAPNFPFPVYLKVQFDLEPASCVANPNIGYGPAFNNDCFLVGDNPAKYVGGVYGDAQIDGFQLVQRNNVANGGLNFPYEFSVSFWINAKPETPVATIMMKDESFLSQPDNGWKIQLLDTGSIQFQMCRILQGVSTCEDSSPTSSIVAFDNQWHHVVVSLARFDSQYIQVSIYVDCAFASFSYMFSGMNPVAPVVVWPATETLNGIALDDIQLYNTPMTDSDVRFLSGCKCTSTSNTPTPSITASASNTPVTRSNTPTPSLVLSQSNTATQTLGLFSQSNTPSQTRP